jgi:hypothetical protein
LIKSSTECLALVLLNCTSFIYRDFKFFTVSEYLNFSRREYISLYYVFFVFFVFFYSFYILHTCLFKLDFRLIKERSGKTMFLQLLGMRIQFSTSTRIAWRRTMPPIIWLIRRSPFSYLCRFISFLNFM